MVKVVNSGSKHTDSTIHSEKSESWESDMDGGMPNELKRGHKRLPNISVSGIKGI